MDWDWAVGGITDEIPRTTGPECINYMTDRRRWTETALLSVVFIYIMHGSWKRLAPIRLPPAHEIQKPHSAMRLLLLISMSVIFGIEMGFKLAGGSMIFALNPCHVQTCLQIYLLAAKPTKVTTALFRIQMSNLNGPFLAFLFPEVEGRTYPFEQATYWIQHALLYLIPIYILRTGAYTIEDLGDFKWSKIGTAFMLFYHFVLLSPLSILTGINLDHMLCAAVSDPFQGQNYRLFACCHQTLLCPLLSKGTALIFASKKSRCNENAIHNNAVDGCETYMPTGSVSGSGTGLGSGSGPGSDHVLYHQMPVQQEYMSADSITAEYTMPTTKID
ncbi:PREDICTED: transmembrane protein 164 [Drosophila arizonae]|uniref:Transmembrane protein 164 n=1 Tax=Drosophila arizonae TaxID=7263 RepID=A0ABM1PHE1_DROAR|nr:PREDICTED: transmembrane protein 164 [Drosophila arizonae]XP_017866625.1 PREDICTED: transmembrane protein 164 [Drosophila arizonae]XP_017866626.1 PREDICTED: transmembrane protein 164 [Drosophila arizonae]XP_017866627.1 PREDICTED: transmembrane protein 164 [Drosophila arizonae]